MLFPKKREKSVMEQPPWRIIVRADFWNREQGFTLIELLVVMIIVSVFIAISLPAFLQQIGKAREVEAKTNLGAIIRSQQAYHLEKRSFASKLDFLTINGQFGSRYYSFTDPAIATDTVVKHQADATDPLKDRTRNFAIGVYYEPSSGGGNGLFTKLICQSKDVNESVGVPDVAGDDCLNDGLRLE